MQRMDRTEDCHSENLRWQQRKQQVPRNILFGETYALFGIQPMAASYNEEDDGESRLKTKQPSIIYRNWHSKLLVINGASESEAPVHDSSCRRPATNEEVNSSHEGTKMVNEGPPKLKTIDRTNNLS